MKNYSRKLFQIHLVLRPKRKHGSSTFRLDLHAETQSTSAVSIKERDLADGETRLDLRQISELHAFALELRYQAALGWASIVL